MKFKSFEGFGVRLSDLVRFFKNEVKTRVSGLQLSSKSFERFAVRLGDLIGFSKKGLNTGFQCRFSKAGDPAVLTKYVFCS